MLRNPTPLEYRLRRGCRKGRASAYAAGAMLGALGLCWALVGPADPATDPAPRVAGGAEGDTAAAGEAPSDESKPRSDGPPADNRPQRRRWGPTAPSPSRKFLVGIEGVVIQAPVLRTEGARLDPRFIGRSVVMGGLGILGRYRPVPVLALDVGVRSGSLRYTDRDDESVISSDHVLAEVGALVYLIRAESTQLAIDGGVGGAFNRVEFELVDQPRGVQVFGSGLVRVGADVEFSFKRVAVLLSLRSYGVFTDRSRVDNRGELFAGLRAPAPLATLQTWLVGSAGIAYRF
jgi:hypothetical protein